MFFPVPLSVRKHYAERWAKVEAGRRIVGVFEPPLSMKGRYAVKRKIRHDPG
jgi:hypothetical protein